VLSETEPLVDRQYRCIHVGVRCRYEPNIRMAVVDQPHHGRLDAFSETAPAPRPGDCGEHLIDTVGIARIPRRLADGRDGVTLHEHDQGVVAAVTVEFFVPSEPCRQFRADRWDIKFAERQVGIQCFELRYQAFDPLARHAIGVDLPVELRIFRNGRIAPAGQHGPIHIGGRGAALDLFMLKGAADRGEKCVAVGKRRLECCDGLVPLVHEIAQGPEQIRSNTLAAPMRTHAAPTVEVSGVIVVVRRCFAAKTPADDTGDFIARPGMPAAVLVQGPAMACLALELRVLGNRLVGRVLLVAGAPKDMHGGPFRWTG
jgi:hypothetical protein